MQTVIVKNTIGQINEHNATRIQVGKQPNLRRLPNGEPRRVVETIRKPKLHAVLVCSLYVTYDILSSRNLKLNQNFRAVDFWKYSPTIRFVRFPRFLRILCFVRPTKPQTGESATKTPTAITTTNIPQIPFLIHHVHQCPKRIHPARTDLHR